MLLFIKEQKGDPGYRSNGSNRMVVAYKVVKVLVCQNENFKINKNSLSHAY